LDTRTGHLAVKIWDLSIPSGECYNIPNRVLLKIELGMDWYKLRRGLQFDIIVVSKFNSIGSQSGLKNEHIIEYPIERKTLKSFYSKISFYDLERYSTHPTILWNS
jgi:hypothetical protein